MAQEAHLIIDGGPDKGREVVVTPGNGMRIGRSSSNDLPVLDPSVSRFHCRLFVKENEGLWVADLGSSNQTLVNKEPIQEKKIGPGDCVMIGDTVLRVISDGTGAAAAVAVPRLVPPTEQPQEQQSEQPPAQPAQASSGPFVDLGLKSDSRGRPEKKSGLRIVLLAVAGLVALACLAAWALKLTQTPPESNGGGGNGGGGNGGGVEQPMEDLAIRYEKVDGSSENVFWYSLELVDGKARVEVHDLKNIHYSKPMTKIEDKVIKSLISDIKQSGFFKVAPTHVERSPTRNVHDLRDLTITLGTKVHRVKVLNALEPPDFDKMRRSIEEFGRVQFGIIATANSAEELTKLASEAMLLGKKLYEEKNVRHENLFKAIRAFSDAVNLLETVDPKPEFFREVVGLRGECSEELKKLCDDLRWKAERATTLKDWEEAAKWLRVLLASVPDREDPRHKVAETKLIEVERHLGH